MRFPATLPRVVTWAKNVSRRVLLRRKFRNHDDDADKDDDDDDGDDDDDDDDDDVGDDDDDDNVIQGLSLTQPVLAKGRKSGRAKQSLYWRPMIANISLPASLPFHKSKPWKYFSNHHLRRADREMIDSDESGEM